MKGVISITNFIYFVLGIVFIQWILPLGDSIYSLISTGIEYLKVQLGYKITQYNTLIEDLNTPESTMKQVIGFDTTIEKKDDQNE